MSKISSLGGHARSAFVRIPAVINSKVQFHDRMTLKPLGLSGEYSEIEIALKRSSSAFVKCSARFPRKPFYTIITGTVTLSMCNR